MNKKHILIIKIISAFFGLSSLLGFIWFGEYYESRPVVFTLFEMSTGMTLLLFALMPLFLINNIMIRIILIILIIVGSASCIYKIIGHWTLVNGPDYGAIILQVIILCIMIIILKYLIKKMSNSEDSILNNKKDSAVE